MLVAATALGTYRSIARSRIGTRGRERAPGRERTNDASHRRGDFRFTSATVRACPSASKTGEGTPARLSGRGDQGGALSGSRRTGLGHVHRARPTRRARDRERACSRPLIGRRHYGLSGCITALPPRALRLCIRLRRSTVIATRSRVRLVAEAVNHVRPRFGDLALRGFANVIRQTAAGRTSRSDRGDEFRSSPARLLETLASRWRGGRAGVAGTRRADTAITVSAASARAGRRTAERSGGATDSLPAKRH